MNGPRGSPVVGRSLTPSPANPAVGVDLNDGHLALRRLNGHGNPVGRPKRIDIDCTGTSLRRDAQVRHAITRLIHYTRQHAITAIAVEDLDFADARTTGRETMGHGRRGKRFRRTVAGIPTAVFRNRLTAQAHHAGITMFAVNPAYTSTWGGLHWQRPYPNVTRHQAAATVIGRRAQGFKARRRKGVTPRRPEDRPVRATNQTAPNNPQANTSGRHRPGKRGKHIPLTQPDKNAVTGPGNRYPGNGQQQPTTPVTVPDPKHHSIFGPATPV
jgi:IS605 OrfB family transposase